MRQTSTKARARYKPRQEKMFILLRDHVPETGQTRIVQLIGASVMTGRNILMYFPWSRPDEEGAPLGNLDNRFGALFELRRLQWPKYEALADIERFNQGIAGFLDNILLQNYSLFREDARIRTGNDVRLVERCTAEGKVTLLDGNFLGSVDILIIVSFDSQRTGQHASESEVAAIRNFLDDPGH